MFGASVFVFQLRHLLFRAVEHAAELIRKTKIDSGTNNFGTALKLAGQSFAQPVRRHTDFLEQRLSDAIALIKQRRQKMLVTDLLMIELRSDILRRLQRFLHLL